MVSLPVLEVIPLSSERGVPLESEESKRYPNPNPNVTLPCITKLANDLARLSLGVPFSGCRCCWMVRHSWRRLSMSPSHHWVIHLSIRFWRIRDGRIIAAVRVNDSICDPSG